MTILYLLDNFFFSKLKYLRLSIFSKFSWKQIKIYLLEEITLKNLFLR